MKWWLLLLISSTLIGCTSVREKAIDQDKAIKFLDTHIEKVIKRDFTAAYLDYHPDFRSSLSLQQFKDVFENQLDTGWGKLKSAEFKSISFGKRVTLGKTFNIAVLLYRAKIDKPNTFIRAEIVEKDGVLFVLSYQYINFVGDKIPPELR